MTKKTTEKKQLISKKPRHISNSQIELAKCLYAYKQIRLLNTVENDSQAMREGKWVHDVIYHYTKACCEQKIEEDFQLIEEIIDMEFEKSLLPEEVLVATRPKLLEFAEKGIRFDEIMAYEIRKRVNISTGKIVDVKTHSEDYEINELEPIVEVVLDRVNGYKMDGESILEVIDYKNSRRIFTKDEVENHLQLKTYRYIAATFLYPGIRHIRSGIYHTQYNFCRWTDMKPVMECGIEFENTEKYLHRQWTKIMFSPAEDYDKPTKCENCLRYSGCPVMNAGKCPAWSKKEIENMKKGSLDDQVRVARKLDMEAKKFKETVKKKFELHDPIEVDGKKAGYKESPTVKYPFKEYHDFAMDRAVPVDHITISKTDAEKPVKKLIKQEKLDSAEMEKLAEMKIESKSTRFTI